MAAFSSSAFNTDAFSSDAFDFGTDDVDPFPGEALGIGSRRFNRRRYGGLWCLLLIPLLAGCANGESPTAPCPVAALFVTFDGAGLVSDSVDYTPEC